MHTRREVLRGTAAPIAIAAMGAGAAYAVAVRDDSAIEAAGAASPTLTGPDARLEELYRAWRKAEAAFGEACETEFDSIVNFEGIEVEGPDGNAHTCKAESDLKSIFPGPIPLTSFSDADLGAFVVAARGP